MKFMFKLTTWIASTLPYSPVELNFPYINHSRGHTWANNEFGMGFRQVLWFSG